VIVFVPGCVALTWWQASRALSGNTLSWVYTFEWPIFAAYAVYMWWKLLHDEPEAEPRDGAGAGAPVGAGEEGGTGRGEDDELAAYNRYLADLNASGRQKRW
jgi:DNA-binding transcriptional regulator of glucitol operon